MVNILARFKRIATAFDEGAMIRSCDESSGSEHSADLSDLVNSFFESEIREKTSDYEEINDHDDQDINRINEDVVDDDELERNSRQVSSLKKLFDRENDDIVRSTIYMEVSKALSEGGGGNSSSPEFKRGLMTRLRDRGFDAGLCKSRWEKNGRCPSGDYEYIDINASGNRYMIEVFLAGQFTIARPTTHYSSLLEIFPSIFVGKPDDLKKLARIMCNAIRKSMKSADIHVPPWRRLVYLQAMWFGFYKRTTNEISNREMLKIGRDWSSGIRSVGFVSLPLTGISFYCRDDYANNKGAVRVGNLAKALKQEI